ncbi:MAG: sugar phosphate isomerase/epimerase [Clostridia bacterium]|nr:sugar phosphate isomerase/epimerase [Clostridia bacterium]
MKLSLYNGSSARYTKTGVSFFDTLVAIRECGFTCVDLRISPLYLEGDRRATALRIKDDIARAGLTATQAHAPGGNAILHFEKAVDTIAKTLEFCHYLEIPAVVVHPSAVEGNTREEFFENNIAFYRALIPYMEAYGVGVEIENIGNYADPYFLWNGSDLREMIDRVDHPMVTACWDIGHANHFFEKDCDQYQSILSLGDKLTSIHAHDNCGYITDTYKHIRLDAHTMPYYSAYASVNWDAVLQGLKDIGYQGTFNFEVHTAAPSDRADFIYQGKIVDTLASPPLSVWKAVNTALYEIGKAMLCAYDLYEE